ncbi:MAG TPA: DUF4097 family beta strand repeat-containing protein [Anaerolineales bacterium]|nr:DUF4097 family beta strand repeat-containing protein [Anaerolineales bacterium]
MKRPIVISLLVIALAFVCLGIGAVLFFTANGGFPTNNPFDQRNISSALEESKTLQVDAEKPLTLNVASAAGSVTVTGANVDSVEIKVVKTAYDSSQSRADEEVKDIKYTIEQTGNAITITYELPKSMNFSNKVNTVDFDVTVPTEVTVDVDSSAGEVNIAGTKGNVDIKSNFGDVSIEDVEGAVSVQTSSGEVTATSVTARNENIDLHSDFGAVTLRNASADNVTLDSNSGRITLEEVRATGDINTRTDFGDTTFGNGSGDSLSIETNSGRVSLVKIRVSNEIKVQDDFGEIELEQAAASSYDLNTNSGSITVDGAKGNLKAHTDFGGIKITNAQSVTLDLKTSSGTVEFSGSLGDGPHVVDSDFGEIDLTLPADSKIDVDLSTDFGTIKSDLPITVTLNGSSNSDGDQVVGSINGGGDQFTAQTSSGSVTIHASQ